MTFRPPLITKAPLPAQQEALRSQVSQNLLLTVLAVAAVFPVGTQYDFPNPRGPVYPVSLRTWAPPPLSQTTLAPPITLMARAPLRTLPPIGAPRPIDSLTWIQSPAQIPSLWRVPLYAPQFAQKRIAVDAPPNLLTSTLAVTTAAAPFVQTDWPVPRARAPAISLRTWTSGPNPPPTLWRRVLATPRFSKPWAPQAQQHNLLLTSLSVQGNPRISQCDWPIPRGRTTPTKAEQFPNVALLSSVDGLPQQMPVPVEIGNPFISVYSNSLRTWTVSLNPGAGIAAALRPSQYEWQNPRGYSYAVTLRTWVDSVKLNLAGQDNLRIAQFDWPNPPPRKVQQPFDQQNLLSTLLATIQLTPFAQSDWPNPRGPVPANSLKTWVDGVKVNLAGQDNLRISQYDWPNPRGPQRVIDLLTQAAGIPAAANVPPTPFFQTDWPVPKGAVPAVVLRTHIDQVKLNLLGQDTLPFFQTDWPVPKGPVPAISLRTAIDPLKLNLLSQDVFFGAPGQGVANLDWPVPKGRMPSISLKFFTINTLENSLIPPIVFIDGNKQVWVATAKSVTWVAAAKPTTWFDPA